MTEQSLLALSKRITDNQLSNEDIELINQLFFSYDNEKLPNFDLIVVLAGQLLNRMEVALELYQKEKAPILISGGNLSNNGQREWENYFHYAESHGISSSNLFVEGESTNTYENLYNCLKIIEKKWPSSNVVFVSSSHHLLRVYLTLKKVLKSVPISITYSFYPACTKSITKENWLFSPSSRVTISKELKKIVKYQLFPYW